MRRGLLCQGTRRQLCAWSRAQWSPQQVPLEGTDRPPTRGGAELSAEPPCSSTHSRAGAEGTDGTFVTVTGRQGWQGPASLPKGLPHRDSEGGEGAPSPPRATSAAPRRVCGQLE